MNTEIACRSDPHISHVISLVVSLCLRNERVFNNEFPQNAVRVGLE